MKMNRCHIIPIFALLVSCTSLEEKEGSVVLGIDGDMPEPVEVELETRSEIKTKVVTDDQIKAFAVWVEGTSINGLYGDIATVEYKLPVGSYTAYAHSSTDEVAEAGADGYGVVRYFGSVEFEVKPLELTKNAVITCRPANSRVVVALSEDFEDYFDASRTSVRISDSQDFSSRALAMLPSSSVKEAYFTPGDKIYAEVITSKVGADTEVTYRIPVIDSAVSGTSYKVMMSVDRNTTSGGITFTISGTDIVTNDFLNIQTYTVVSDFTEDL